MKLFDDGYEKLRERIFENQKRLGVIPKDAKIAPYKTQYFEMFGQWALYDEGWVLSTKVNRAPWDAFGAVNPAR